MAKSITGRPGESAGWARGLRQLYHRMAYEPVPADLADLLARLQRSAASRDGPEYSS
ncbi:MAG: hypothetical protein M3N34_01775 [Pseudomonadota bacterium]|nr:hypothetical protein [Pseudomonadota bacterium]